MNAFITMLITLMPFFAMLPLAVAGVIIVALIASPRVRDAFAEWFRRRLRLDSPADPAIQRGKVAELQGTIARLEDRLSFLERVVTDAPRLREADGRPKAEDAGARLPGGRTE